MPPGFQWPQEFYAVYPVKDGDSDKLPFSDYVSIDSNESNDRTVTNWTADPAISEFRQTAVVNTYAETASFVLPDEVLQKISDDPEAYRYEFRVGPDSVRVRILPNI